MDNTQPSFPAGGTLRLATINDIPRIAVVATAGFFYPPIFGWERRYHKQYPKDTLNSYKKRFVDLIRDPGSVVLVAENSYQTNENSATGAIIPAIPDEKTYQKGESMIVGIAAWKLSAVSVHFDRFVNQDDLSDSTVFDGGLGRDKDRSHALPLYESIEIKEDNYFRGHMIVEMVVVHLTYWRRGHAKSLLKWGLGLAESDGVKSGVFATPMGEQLYLSLDFVRAGLVSLKDEEDPRNELEFVILRHYGSEVM